MNSENAAWLACVWPREISHHNRDPDAAAEVAHQTEKRGGFVAQAGASEAKVMVDSGTKTKPSPKPCTTPVRTMSRALVLRSNPVISQSEKTGEREAEHDHPAHVDAA